MTTSLEERFVAFAGEMAESFSFNRSLGQIYGLLYIHPEPLSLDEISGRLGMSKGNASINARVLESWGAVRSVSVGRSRRDHYEVNRDLRRLLLRRIEEGVAKRLDLIEENLGRLASEDRKSEEDVSLRPRLQEIRALVSSGRKALRLMPKLAGFFR